MLKSLPKTLDYWSVLSEGRSDRGELLVSCGRPDRLVSCRGSGGGLLVALQLDMVTKLGGTLSKYCNKSENRSGEHTVVAELGLEELK